MLEAEPMPAPAPLRRGLPGIGRQAGFPLELSSEWAPRRGEKAPRGHVESLAKRLSECFSEVHASRISHLHSGMHVLLCPPPARPTPPTLAAWFVNVAVAYRHGRFELVDKLLLLFCHSVRIREKAYSTWYSQAVSHPSTNQARPCLASEIGRDRACSGWCGRKR